MDETFTEGSGAETENRRHNRLITEKSPYLRQHAYNPVDWYPWGEEAFERARREDKPIFLSIGYSTCHWCHVMERESFEDPEVAQLMNEAFVCIKVDREERPDIDAVYMAVCQMMTGTGGWPLTILMTPDKLPFIAGTYFPKRSRSERVGIMELIPHIREMWQERRHVVLTAASSLLESLRETRRETGVRELGDEELSAAGQGLSERFDEVNGGFGNAPKFPSPHNMLFLLRYWWRTGAERSLEMVDGTLKAMRRGGIFDQLGGGFHRYSTDEGWLLPHFEKMLYDQAMLAMAYVEACQATGKTSYRETAEEIFRYVLRDMTDSGGGFFSAEDADSEGVEGKFYLWSLAEIRDVLRPPEAEFAGRVFGLSEDGNFREEATGRQTGTNVLHLKEPLDGVAAAMGLSVQEATNLLREVSRKLLQVRERRTRPQRDNKILVDWNGLMIGALAKGAAAFDEPAYAKAAKKAADFVIGRMKDGRGRLLHRYCDGESAITAHLDDYAFFIWGLMEIYEATFEVHYLKEALALNRLLLKHFWDNRSGGFFLTSEDAETLLVRPKEVYDGAIPSGNGVAMLNLARLGRMTADPSLEEKAVELGLAFAEEVRRFPSAHTQLLMAVDFLAGPAYEIVLSGDPGSEEMLGMQRALRTAFLPRKVVLCRPLGKDAGDIDSIAGFTEGLSPLGGRVTAYVCREHQCQLPVTEMDEMLRLVGAENGPAGRLRGKEGGLCSVGRNQ
jgi:uncharacterized protein YyaL (SSP411 family)